MHDPPQDRDQSAVDRAGSELLASMVEHSPLGMSLTWLDSSAPPGARFRSIVVNKAMADMLGYTQQELLEGGDQRSHTHPDDEPADRAHVEELATGSVGSLQWEKRYLHRDGHTVWARVSGSLIHAQDGSQYVVAQIEDITELRRLEDDLDGALGALDLEHRTVENLRQALNSRIVIEQAKGVLAEAHGISVDDAFRRLRAYARARSVSIHIVASAVVKLGLRP